MNSLAIPNDRRLPVYESMRLIRRFEERTAELLDAGDIPGTSHLYIGEEAVAVGVCEALRSDDVITSTHRGHGHLIAKGADVRRMMAELFARREGLNHGRGGSMHVADVTLGIFGANGIVGAGVPWAVGAAWASMQQRSDRVAVAFFGDGGINQGVVHEAMNLAAIWQLPVVFVCENNQYAVTMPIEKASAVPVFERASSYGFPSRRVDGMDVDVVYREAVAAVGRAREGHGPTFLECLTYRFGGHHVAERVMKLQYRTDDEIDRWRRLDPLEGWVAASDLSPASREEADGRVERALEDAVAFARSSTKPSEDEALEHAYASDSYPSFPMNGWQDA